MFIGREEKEIILGLINDDVDLINTYLELKNTVNVQLSLEGIDRPPIMRNFPPLISVAIFLHAERCVSALAMHKSNLDVRDDAGRAPVHFAAAGGELEMLEMLADQGADLTATDNKNRTILHYAAQFTEPNVVQWILSNDLDLNVDDDAGYTPLHLAADSGDNKVVELLINSGMPQTKSVLGVCFMFIGLQFSSLPKMII